jgi:hypothetical protein
MLRNYDVDYSETYAPIAKTNSLQVLSIVAIRIGLSIS